ncbi:MAG: hypothetical protein ACE15D_18875 [Candidatus Eisenbacteria bacterium]
MTEWSEASIASILQRDLFARAHVVVDNCNWTGHECDLLVVTTNMQIIDVEIKISRSDMRADAKKEKWWDRRFLGYGPEEVCEVNGHVRWITRPPIHENTARQWPPKVWKHYYAMPREIWTDAMLPQVASERSGIVLVYVDDHGGHRYEVKRRATANVGADKISEAQALGIARLANLRMWNAYRDLSVAKNDVNYWRAKAQEVAA